MPRPTSCFLILLRKYVPIAVCILGGFYVLLYSGSIFRSFGTVCITKTKMELDTYGITKHEPQKDVGTKYYNDHIEDPDRDGLPGPGLDDLEPYLDSSMVDKSDCNCANRWEQATVNVKNYCVNKRNTQTPLVTLFTTMNDDPGRTNVHVNTLRMWPKLGHKVKPILFITCSILDSALANEACKNGWIVSLVPSCDTHEMPVLRTMFIAAQHISNSVYYGYANADILFSNSLVETLDFLQFQIGQTRQFQQNLIIGSRTDLEMESNLYITSLQQIVDLSAKGEPAFVTFIDYFISFKNGYPWASMPPLVVGRRGFDNWLVMNARKSKIATFDATETILAAHQGGQGIAHVPHLEREGGDVNNKMTGNTNLLEGLISCTKFTIRPDASTKYGLYWRKKAAFCGHGVWPDRDNWADIVAKDELRKIRIIT